MPMNKWYVIINPVSGGGKGAKYWPQIERLLREHNFDFDHSFTEYKDHINRLIKSEVEKGNRHFIICGGDGSIAQAANAVLEQTICPSSEIILALIPTGTGNDWARMNGIPVKLREAVNVIVKNKQMLQDAGAMEDSNKRTRYFTGIAGAGYEAIVVRYIEDHDPFRKGGILKYMLSLFRCLIGYKSSYIELEIDDIRLSGKIFSVAIGNTKYNGGGMMQCPDASLDDGKLDITVINHMSKAQIIWNTTKLHNGSFVKNKHVAQFKCEQIRMSSNEEVFIESDGESFSRLPAHITVIPKCLRVITNL